MIKLTESGNPVKEGGLNALSHNQRKDEKRGLQKGGSAAAAARGFQTWKIEF
jgi:hypothetical protein